jgi:hypothetical protein
MLLGRCLSGILVINTALYNDLLLRLGEESNSQDDYKLACTGLQLEFIILHDIKPNKHLIQCYTHSLTERTMGSFYVKKAKLINDVPLEESKTLTDSSFEVGSRLEKEGSYKTSKKVVSPDKVKSGCRHELCNINGEMHKYLKGQIRDLVRKEVDNTIKKEMQKMTMMSEYSTPRCSNATDDNGCTLCDRCSLIIIIV